MIQLKHNYLSIPIEQGIPEVSYNPIAISSLYGLILSIVKVVLVGPVGSLVDWLPRKWGTGVPLLLQNISVAINAIFISKLNFVKSVTYSGFK